ncbi:hypothetical protein KY386_02405 [Candidatus Parcubacteria bacterium]|nr:hypothetical protein [Candidatus Parcubacteria bacterium]
MELKDFIVRTVADIHGAIDDIKKETGKNYKLGNLIKDSTRIRDSGGKVQFDVAVVQSKNTEGGGKVKVGGISVVGVQAQGQLATTDQNTSRIKFELTLGSGTPEL